MKDQEIMETGMNLRFITDWLHGFLADMGVMQSIANYLVLFILVALSLVLVYAVKYIIWYVLRLFFSKVGGIDNLAIFHHLIENKFPNYIGVLIPYAFLSAAIPFIYVDFPSWISPLTKILNIYMVLVIIKMIMSVIESFVDTLKKKPAFENKSFKSYLQVIQIVLFIIGFIAVYCILTERSPVGLFAAMGAASAVLMLMFQSTIMGFVASIQISSNDMARLGDWVTMNKYGADGTVEEINLTTVKVRNFDQTITTIPTQGLISDSFQNWRGMSESGGRRFQRAVMVKQSSVCYVKPNELDKYRKIGGLSVFIDKKLSQYESINATLEGKDDHVLNGFILTNVMLYVEYLNWYLKSHPLIKKDMTLLVRQQAANVTGLPIQLYAFTSTVWAEYEHVTGEVYAHAIAAAQYFDLVVFEQVSDNTSVKVDKQG